MKIKEGVILAGLKLPMRKVLKTANKIWANHGQELVVTSGLDGTHSAGSYHYYGYAVDLRTRYFDEDRKSLIASELKKRLGGMYTVVLEKTHIHVQFNA